VLVAAVIILFGVRTYDNAQDHPELMRNDPHAVVDGSPWHHFGGMHTLDVPHLPQADPSDTVSVLADSQHLGLVSIETMALDSVLLPTASSRAPPAV